MTYSTDVFIYTQRQIVVLTGGISTRRFMPVYSKVLTLNKGVDNSIQFQFLNQQQKSVDITGMELTFRIISSNGSKVIFAKTLNMSTTAVPPAYPANGIATLEVGAAELEELDSQRCYYSIEYTRNNGNTNYAVYQDAIAGARGDLVIADSILPRFLPCVDVTVPSDQLFPNNEMYMSQCAQLGAPAQALTYYSSAISTENNPVLTFQVSYTQFSGSITIEGAVTNDDTSWYPIYFEEGYNYLTDTRGYTITGYHPYVRLKWNSWSGSVGNILVR